MTRANFVSGVGGTNTPNFFASHSNDQTMNDNTITKITYDNEVFDTGSNYDVSNYRYTPGFVGKSFIGASAWSSDNNSKKINFILKNFIFIKMDHFNLSRKWNFFKKMVKMDITY